MDEPLHAIALLLVTQKLLTKEEAIHYQHAAQSHSCRFLPYLVTYAAICPNRIAQSLAKHFGLILIDLECLDKTTLPKHILPPQLLRQHHVLPIRYQDNQLWIAVDDPSQQSSFQAIQFLTGCHIVPMVAQTLQLTKMIDERLRDEDHQGLTQYLNTDQHTRPSMDGATSSLLTPVQINEDEAPIVAFVHRILLQAITKGATDIHFEPYESNYRVRYRQDGILYELATPPQPVATRITARLKIMADLDIAERRLPQDGRFSFAYAQKQSIDCRISTCPTIHGEKIAIRLLNNRSVQPKIEDLRFTTRDKQHFLSALGRTQGLILVTGPTGSGKTMSLYAALHYLNTGEKNISTAEDPVEIKMFGINQVQVNLKIELSFSRILRSFLRQDPDIIMIGEIRDEETADIAIKASHTGHLVLSTLHTNSSAETIIRLKQLGIDPFLLASSIRLIIAQRLVRQLCPYCKKPSQTRDTPTDLAFCGYTPKGCHRCQQGYQGRVAIFEVMPISNHLQQLMLTPNITAHQLTYAAQEEGMLTIQQAGLEYYKTGVTSFEEIQRIC